MTLSASLSPERVSWHLWNWERWQRRPESDGDYPQRASGGMGRSGSADFDSMADAAEARCAEAVDTIINDLPHAQRIAVHQQHGIAVYRLPRTTIEEAYALAIASIGRGLASRGIA